MSHSDEPSSGLVKQWGTDVASAWDRFWFRPAMPHTLAAIRILAGWMLFYTHLIWTLELESFLGPHSWINSEASRSLASMQGSSTWSYLWYIESPWLLWLQHFVALTIFLLLMIGLWTRVVAVLAWLITLAYCHRLTGTLFGLDQVNVMLSMYLMIGPAGAMYSVDRWLAARKQGRGATTPPLPAISTNVAIRLIQVHMCVIYLFGGIGKMRGVAWWVGDAFWFSIANYEYQSWDVTWLAASPLLIALITHLTVFWETFYCVLVWPRLTRPLMLGMAVIVHGGIALALGMPTFGFAMLIGNLAFVSPGGIQRLVARLPLDRIRVNRLYFVNGKSELPGRKDGVGELGSSRCHGCRGHDRSSVAGAEELSADESQVHRVGSIGRQVDHVS